MRNKTIVASLVGVLIAIFGAGILMIMMNPEPLIKRALDRQIKVALSAQNIPAGRFEVLFCGTGSPQHHEDRGQPCLGIIANGKLFLFDSGQGSAQRLGQFNAPIRKLDTIFLTHLHSDHMSGLGETLHNGWLYGRQHLVNIVGPPGTEKTLAGFQQAYHDDIEERQRVLGPEYLDSRSGMGTARDVKIDDDAAHTVYEEGGVLIEAFQVNHPDWPYAYGYRFSYRGKVIIVSGDTAYTDVFKRHAQGADILIHEVINLDLMKMAGKFLAKHGSDINQDRLDMISEVHTPTHLVAKTAAESNVKSLVLTHIIPPIPANNLAESYYIKGMDKIYDGEIVFARDGMRIMLFQE